MPRRSALVLVVFILCSVAAFGEPAAPTVPGSLQAKRTSMPLDHLYRHFLESQIYFDKEADKQQQKGCIARDINLPELLRLPPPEQH